MIGLVDGHLEVGGVDSRRLAERFGTPLFVYDADVVRETYRRIRAAVRHRPSRVHYAAVCNPNLALLRILRDEGAGLHANTPGDVFCGLRAGFSPRDIVFSGSNLGDEDVDYLTRSGVHVNVDSIEDVVRVCRRAPERAIGVRVHLDDVLPESRIGLREEQLAEALHLAASFGCRVTALHVYCGTHGQKLALWARAAQKLFAIASRVPDLDCVNLGGGFGYDYRDPDVNPFPFASLAREVEQGLEVLAEKIGRPVTLRMEPGRALVAAAGVLLTRVRSVKHRCDRRYVGVDTTVANFTSPVVHGPYRRVVPIESGTSLDVPTTVCGCTTYSRDFVARDAPLPDVTVGDLLAVLDVGAYGYCMASHFLNRPKPAEVVVDAGAARVVTRRGSFSDLVTAQIESERRGTV
jgi:diaminopimelate decarboxylase